jgi:hypothetical protein
MKPIKLAMLAKEQKYEPSENFIIDGFLPQRIRKF